MFTVGGAAAGFGMNLLGDVFDYIGGLKQYDMAKKVQAETDRRNELQLKASIGAAENSVYSMNVDPESASIHKYIEGYRAEANRQADWAKEMGQNSLNAQSDSMFTKFYSDIGKSVTSMFGKGG
jgi:hypothetical protein